MFALSDVLAGTNGRLVTGAEMGAFRSVSIDSRTASRASLFFAFHGQKHNGHDFVMQAFGRGASGAIVETLPPQAPWAAPEWSGPPVILTASSGQALQDLATYWRQRHGIRVVGVTGSVGKTTTKELIASTLARRYSVLRTTSNLNTEIGLPLTLMELGPEHQVAVLEMAMYDVGEIRRLAAIARPEVGVVTNVGYSHLERLGTIERISEAKSELVRELPASGLAVLNADDPRVSAMAEMTTARVVRYGVQEGADFWADEIESHGLRGIEFTVHYENHRLRAKLALLGTHSVHAALAAIAVATNMGMEFDDAMAALHTDERGVRLLVEDGIQGTTILDDTYNANPASTLAALNLLAEMDGRRVAVLGDMLELGSFEAEGHQLVGRRAAAVADWVLAVGSRARIIADEARLMKLRATTVETFDNNEEVIERLRQGLRPGDFVLMKGSRGMRLDEVVSAIRVG
ncbi:MAG: putative udp-n-acetylmuramoylalanyl-d-glutamyl-2,6-diaminopimelate--d-alanyl-d-alanyl ligase protein [Chloroflexi bacterium]|nr:putative udp-n-acetylmuramoylalanyl-d-glutamyl-2,6-diaminopimelate--d-alanyl-d-alanyl ligase protein [Chloroflexota bacterium]